MPKVKFSFPAIVIFFLLAFFAFIVFYNLNATPLENWDESFYAEAAKQMIKTHQFILPFFNGQWFLDKPPLQLWITALIGSVFGLSELTVRAPSALSAFIIMVLMLRFSYKCWGLVPAIFAFTTLAFNNIFMWRSRTGNLDALTTLFFVISFLLILSKHKYRYPLLGLTFGLLYMTKLGIVVFPVAIFMVDEIITLRFKIFRNYLNYFLLVICAIFLPAIWLTLGYLQIGQAFITTYIFSATHGVSGSTSLKNFNTDYIMYGYYSLQRRFFWFLILGLLCLLLKIKNRLNIVLLLFSILLWIPLSFSDIRNNWYLMPMMPFWSLTIAYGVWQLLDFVPVIKRFLPKFIKVSYVYGAGVALLLLFCVLIGYKTYTVNITPLYQNFTTIKETQTAKALNNLTNPNDQIVRLGFSYPVTIYYSDRVIHEAPGMSQAQLLDLIAKDNLTWVAGKKPEVEDLIKIVEGKQYQIIPTNDQEEIVKFY
jgi:4-amino-4-deoxy-L-arabinose transferase-like glycosyltransferase